MLVPDLIWSQYLIGLLLTAGFFFTISSKFVQLRMLPEMFRALVERPETLEDGKKGISPFQAFTISAGSRVGTGNIAGVATAIVLERSRCSVLDVDYCIYRCSECIYRSDFGSRFIKYMIKMVDSVVVQLTILLKV